jgi:hypothetical protein
MFASRNDNAGDARARIDRDRSELFLEGFEEVAVLRFIRAGGRWNHQEGGEEPV